MRRQRLLLTSVVVALAAFAWSVRHEGTAMASSLTWQPIAPLGGTGYLPAIASSSNGHVAVAWLTSSPSDESRVESVAWVPGRGWSPPATLSTSDSLSAGPEVGVAGTGESMVVWPAGQEPQVPFHIQMASHQAGGGWSPAKSLSDTSKSVDPDDVDLAVNARGDAIAAWAVYTQPQDSAARIQVSERPAGGEWSAPKIVSTQIGNRAEENPQVAINGNGDAVVAWQATVYGDFGDNDYSVHASVREAGMGWGTEATLHQSKRTLGAHMFVSMDREGKATAVWDESGEPEPELWSRTFSSSWGPSTKVPRPAGWYGCDYAANAKGEAALLCTDDSGGVHVTTRPAGGQFGSVRQLVKSGVEPTGLHGPKLAVTDAGDAIAVWRRNGPDGADGTLEAAYRPANGDWEPPEVISAPGSQVYQPRVTLAGQGNPFVVWIGKPAGAESRLFVRAACRSNSAACKPPEPGCVTLSRPIASSISHPVSLGRGAVVRLKGPRRGLVVQTTAKAYKFQFRLKGKAAQRIKSVRFALDGKPHKTVRPKKSLTLAFAKGELQRLAPGRHTMEASLKLRTAVPVKGKKGKRRSLKIRSVFVVRECPSPTMAVVQTIKRLNRQTAIALRANSGGAPLATADFRVGNALRFTGKAKRWARKTIATVTLRSGTRTVLMSKLRASKRPKSTMTFKLTNGASVVWAGHRVTVAALPPGIDGVWLRLNGTNKHRPFTNPARKTTTTHTVRLVDRYNTKVTVKRSTRISAKSGTAR